MKVADIIHKKVTFISPDATILDAARLIMSEKHTGLPVCNKKGKLVGFITDQDILSKLLPSVKEFIEDYTHASDFEAMEGKISEVMTYKVKQIMSRSVIFVREDIPVLKAESLMKLKDISRLPVVDSKMRLVGILSKRDIFRILFGRKLRRNTSS